MKKCIVILLLFAAFSCRKKVVDGTYTGFEEMCSVDSAGVKHCYQDPARPQWKWYHRCMLKIKNDSVFMDQVPVAIYKKDTTYSASDGAFFYYKGTISTDGDAVTLSLKNLGCDYCGVKIKTNQDGAQTRVTETKTYSGSSKMMTLC